MSKQFCVRSALLRRPEKHHRRLSLSIVAGDHLEAGHPVIFASGDLVESWYRFHGWTERRMHRGKASSCCFADLLVSLIREVGTLSSRKKGFGLTTGRIAQGPLAIRLRH